MSLESVSRGKEAAFIPVILSIFGVVEAEQMRLLFSHVKKESYERIIAKLRREGRVWFSGGGRYLAASEHATECVDLDRSVMVFWAFLSVQHLVREMASGDGETVMTFSSGKFEYDLIYMTRTNHEKILDSCPRLGEKIKRLFVVSDLSDSDEMKFRSKNDYILVVDEKGEVVTYEA